MQMNQTVHLLHFTTTVMTCNSTAMSPHLVYLNNTSLEDTYHVLDNNAIVQMTTCQFLTDCRYRRRNSMDSALFVYLKCRYLLLDSHNLFTLDKQTYDLCVDNLHHSACQAAQYMSCGDAIPMARQTSDNCTQAGIFATYTSPGNTAEEAGSDAKYRC